MSTNDDLTAQFAATMRTMFSAGHSYADVASDLADQAEAHFVARTRQDLIAEVRGMTDVTCSDYAADQRFPHYPNPGRLWCDGCIAAQALDHRRDQIADLLARGYRG